MAAKAAQSCTACEYPRALTSGDVPHFPHAARLPLAVHTEETRSPTEFDLVRHFISKSPVLVPGTLGSSFLCLPGHGISFLLLPHACRSSALPHHSSGEATGPASHGEGTP